MQTRIQKWGNGLGLRIPKSVAKQAGLEAGSEVDLAVEGSDLVAHSKPRPRYQLADLLRGVTARNMHREIDTGRILTGVDPE
jgi:antitoxin MazE